MNADGVEASVGLGPPLVAVAAHRIARRHLVHGAGLKPPVGDDRRAVHPRAVHDPDAEARVVAQTDLETAAARFVADQVGEPACVLLHPDRAPDLLAHVLGERPVRRLHDEVADQVGFARLVDPLAASRRFARELPHVAHRLVEPRVGGDGEEHRHVGLGVRIVLVPLHARGHRQQLPDADTVIGAAAHLRDVLRDGFVDARDETVLDGRAHQRGRHRLGHGKRCPLLERVVAHRVALEAHLAVVHDDDAGRLLLGHVLIEHRGLRAAADERAERSASGEGHHAIPLLDHASREERVHHGEAGLALRLRPEEDRGGAEAPGGVGRRSAGRGLRPGCRAEDERTEEREGGAVYGHVGIRVSG